jgi:hypothetical protein
MVEILTFLSMQHSIHPAATTRTRLICSFGCLLLSSLALSPVASAQSADWQTVVWREPQVRYLLTDLTLGGNPTLYRNYALTEKDPDSREAIRLWDAGVRVVNANDFERRWLTNQFGKDGRVMRVVQRGSERTIIGDEVLLTSDFAFQQAPMRLVLLDLTLGAAPADFKSRAKDPSVVEALRRWAEGDRALNANWFEAGGTGKKRRVVYRHTDVLADGARVQLVSDMPYPECNVRYFLADMLLGGSRGFYHKAAESAHEMGCQEAVARFDAGVKIANLDQLERKQVGGSTLITRKGSDERISGLEVRLSTD